MLQFIKCAFNVSKLTAHMQDIIKIQSSLMKQDEIDKKSIFLMGMREEDQANGVTKG